MRWIRHVAVPLWLAILAPIMLSNACAEGIEDTIAMCAGCHGVAGVPVDPSIPIIWGQNEGYLYLQLRDIKRGSRKVESMDPVMQRLEKPDLQALAAHFAAKPWPNLAQPASSDTDARRALQANTSIGCTGCHAAGFLAAGSVPRLAGQQKTYLAQTLLDFRSGKRANNPGMTDLMNAADPADLAALASYLSGL